MRFIKLLHHRLNGARPVFIYAISRDIRDIFLVRRIVFNEGKVDTPVPGDIFHRVYCCVCLFIAIDAIAIFFSLSPPLHPSFNLPHALIYFLIGFPPPPPRERERREWGKLVCSIANSEITNVHHLTRWINPAENEPCFSVNAISHVISSVKNFYFYLEMKMAGTFILYAYKWANGKDFFFLLFLIFWIWNC